MRLLVFLCTVFFAFPALAGEVKVAVASNFTSAAKEVAAAFEQETGHDVVLSFGSTGKLFTQIAHGAPFQVFLAADEARPERAIAEGLAVAGSRLSYATGRLVLYSADPDLIDGWSFRVLGTGAFRKLALANPKIAPYGAAAVEVMKNLLLFDNLSPKLVRGENIAQTYQFVVSGNAELGFVAGSQVTDKSKGSRWEVPGELHTPIRQDAVLLTRGKGVEAAEAFMEFLDSSTAHAIIDRHGYGMD